MFSLLPIHIRDYAILQMAVSNGASIPWTIQPEDCGLRNPTARKFKPCRPRPW